MRNVAYLDSKASANRPGNSPAIFMFAAAIACLLPVFGPRVAALAGDLLQPGIGPHIANADFVNYWFAGQFVFSGETAILFDPAAYFANLQSWFGEDYDPHNWSYPPHALLFFAPLGLFGYKAGFIVFMATTLVAYLAAAWLFYRRFGIGADPLLFAAAHIAFVFVNIAAAQNGFLTGALLLVFLTCWDRQPMLTGLALAALTVKPQLGLLIPLMLLFAGAWRVIVWATIFTILLFVLSLWLFGWDSWRVYLFQVVPFQHIVMTQWEGSMLLMMPTVLSGLRAIGFDAATAMQVQQGFIAICLPIVIFCLWRAHTPLSRATVLVIGSFLITPYAFNYDMGAMVTVAALLLARSRVLDAASVIAAAICLLPAAVWLLGEAGAPVSPILFLAALLLLRRESARESPAANLAA